ncbi:MAG: hypothetical protein LC794_03380 [Acidobacteria bacterium]|nr:hypothetical protein [Acidobacteriota bacterium]
MPQKRSVNNQTEFPFIGQILHDKTWWTRINFDLMKRPRTPQTKIAPSTVVLISCSKSKLAKKAPARDLYTGNLFRKAVSWAEKQDYTWYVVSALYGLVHPDHSLEPYDFTLKQLRARERESWAHMVVAAELTKHVSKGSHAILIMPQLYRRYIETELRKASITSENPVEHLAIGKQIKWLATNGPRGS